MNDWLTARVKASPESTALWIGNESWTYADLDGSVNALAAHLRHEGVKSGHFVGVLLPNNLVFVCLIHALARLGAVLVPLNSRLTAAELEWQIAHVDCDSLVTEPVQLSNLNSKISRSKIITTDRLTLEPGFPIPNSQFTIQNLQAVLFTSGTSGRPKGVKLTFANHFYSAMASAYRLGVQPVDLWLSCLPLYHVGGLAIIFRSCLYGTAVDLHPRFSLPAVNHSLDTKPITLISLVPTMLKRLLESRVSWPDSLRLALIGGAAATPPLINAALAAGVPVATTYGLTEAGSQVATMLPAAVRQKPGSVGKPLLFTDVKIVADNGREAAANQYGEIEVSGPTVMAGYFQEKGERAEPLVSLSTGDIGYFDEDGDLWLVQRRQDLIISGGENVYPAEVEAVLKTHPAVVNASVVGLPDPEWGQRVAALVVLKEAAQVKAEGLKQFCREKLAGYKIPRQIHFVDSLPLTGSGKIARQAVVAYIRDEDHDSGQKDLSR